MLGADDDLGGGFRTARKSAPGPRESSMLGADDDLDSGARWAGGDGPPGPERLRAAKKRVPGQ